MKLIKEFENNEKKYIEIICKKCGWKNHMYWGEKKYVEIVVIIYLKMIKLSLYLD